MNRSAKSQWIFCNLLRNFTCYSLTFLLSTVFLSESVMATSKRTRLQIAQSSGQTNRAAAAQALAEGTQLYQQGTEESLRKAIEKLQEALKLLRQVDDKKGEAYSLNLIGLVYSGLGEKHKALDYYTQALPLLRAVGDGGGQAEASILISIGTLDDDLGEKQKALSFYNQALPLYQAVRDRRGEATTLNYIGIVYSNLGENQK